MADRASLHVVPALNGGWSVRHYGTRRAWRHFARKTAAVHWGRKVVQARGGEFFIHRQDGSVQEKMHYPDPAQAQPVTPVARMDAWGG